MTRYDIAVCDHAIQSFQCFGFEALWSQHMGLIVTRL